MIRLLVDDIMDSRSLVPVKANADLIRKKYNQTLVLSEMLHLLEIHQDSDVREKCQ